MKRGFTLLELLVSLVVLGTVGAVAIPNYYNSLEKARKSEAEINLKAIHTAEKLYKNKNGVYWGPGSTTINSINSNLNLDLTAVNYADGVNVTGSTNSFQARLQRTGGQATYAIDQTGAFSVYTPPVTTGDGGSVGGGTGGCKGCPLDT